MTLALLVLAAVAAVNAPRARAALPEDRAALVGALGAAATLVASVPLAAFAGPATRTLGLTVPTVRMAVGVVLVVIGVVHLVSRPPDAEPRLAGLGAALVPVAFPVLLHPALGLLVVAASLDRGAPVALAVTAVALATVPLLAARSRGLGVMAGLARVLAALLVLCGFGLLMDGVFDL